MNNWTAAFIIILALFVGFMFGAIFTYTSLGIMLEKVIGGSNVNMQIQLNETKLAEAAYKLIHEEYNFTKDFNQLKNITRIG